MIFFLHNIKAVLLESFTSETDINFQEMSSVSLRCTLKWYTTQHLFSVWHSLHVRGWTAGTLTDVFILFFCCENHRKFNPTTTAGHSRKELWWSITLRARQLTSLSWSEHQTIRSRLTGNQSEPPLTCCDAFLMCVFSQAVGKDFLFTLLLLICLCTTYIQSHCELVCNYISIRVCSCVCVGRHFQTNGPWLAASLCYFDIPQIQSFFPISCEPVSSGGLSFLQFLQHQVKLLKHWTAASWSLNEAAQQGFISRMLRWTEAPLQITDSIISGRSFRVWKVKPTQRCRKPAFFLTASRGPLVAIRSPLLYKSMRKWPFLLLDSLTSVKSFLKGL